MSRTIGLISIKGGVGKTTLSASLASDLANRHGKKVLLIDANYSAPNVGLHMDILESNKTIHDVLAGRARISSAVNSKYGVDVISGSYAYDKEINFLKLKDKISNIKDRYDFVIIDSSPSLNEEVLSTILSSDNLFVVSTPDYPTLSCSMKAAKLAKQRGKPISGIIMNKIRNPRYELSLEEIEEATGIPVVARIPDDATNVRSLFTRIPTSIYDKKCSFSQELSRLSNSIAAKEAKPSIWMKLFSKSFNKEEVNRQFLKKDFYTNLFVG